MFTTITIRSITRIFPTNINLSKESECKQTVVYGLSFAEDPDDLTIAHAWPEVTWHFPLLFFPYLFPVLFFLILFFRTFSPNFSPVFFFDFFFLFFPFFFPYYFTVLFQKSRRLKSNVLKYQWVVFLVHYSRYYTVHVPCGISMQTSHVTACLLY